MNFTRKKYVNELNEGQLYQGIIHSIDLIQLDKGEYYDVKIELDNGIISIWCSSEVNPEHPMFSVFDHFIKDERDAETFDENTLVGYDVEFQVKNITTRNNKTRTFFQWVNLLYVDDETLDNEDWDD